MTFVPLPARAIAGQTRVLPGESLAGLCHRLGQPLNAYPELVGANLHLPLTGNGVPAGQSVVFASLQAGDSLNVPASWERTRFGASHLQGLEGAPGALVDAVTEVIVKTYPYDPKSGLSLPQYSANAAVLAAWWRDMHPNQTPTAADLAKFVGAAVAWWTNVGQHIGAEAATKIPFGEAPLAQIGELYSLGVPLVNNLDKAKINEALAKVVSVGQFPRKDEPIDWTTLSDASFQQLTKIGFKAGEWAELADLRWDLLPVDQILERVKSGKAKFTAGQDMTAWLLKEIGEVVKAAAGIAADIDIDLLSCGPGKIKIGGKCYGLAGPPGAGGCPAGSILYMGQCIQTGCQPGDTAEIGPGGIVCTPGGGGGKEPPVPPTDEKPCPPQGVKKNGKCDCTEKMGPTAQLDEKLWLCVDCGPNATHKQGTTECECLPGFVPNPSGAEGSGCVPAGGTVIKPPPPAEDPYKTAKTVGLVLLAALGIGVGLKAAKVI